MDLQQSVVLIKPDGLQRGLVGEVISRFERKGLKLVGLKMMTLDDPIIEEWYSHHVDKPFFPGLKTFMQQSPIVAMLWEGVECIDAVRLLTGITKARAADAGTIRGDLALSFQMNLVHASDTPENGKKERDIVFKPEEVYEYERNIEVFVYTDEELGR